MSMDEPTNPLQYAINQAVSSALWDNGLTKRIQTIVQEQMSVSLTDDHIQSLVQAAIGSLAPVSADDPETPDAESDTINEITVTLVFKSGAVINVEVPPDIALQMSKHFKEAFKEGATRLGTYYPPNTIPIHVIWTNVEMMY